MLAAHATPVAERTRTSNGDTREGSRLTPQLRLTRLVTKMYGFQDDSQPQMYIL